MTNSDNYSYAINNLLELTFLNGELPNIYSDSYKDAVIALLLKEKEDCIKNKYYGYLSFSCLMDAFRGNGEIFSMISEYMRHEEEDERKNKIAIKIADSIVDSASLYYRDDIEHHIFKLYKRANYGESN
jgi:hypothetical protein